MAPRLLLLAYAGNPQSPGRLQLLRGPSAQQVWTGGFGINCQGILPNSRASGHLDGAPTWVLTRCVWLEAWPETQPHWGVSPSGDVTGTEGPTSAWWC